MIWRYPLLFALLFRIAAAQTNPFTLVASDVVLGEPFHISWEPTTEGTVTVTLWAVSETNGESTKIDTLATGISNTGSFDSTLTQVTFSTFYSFGITSDEDPSVTSRSSQFSIRDGTEGVATTRSAPPAAGETSEPTDVNGPASSQSHTGSNTTTGTATADTTTTGSSLPSEASTSSSTGLSAGATAGIGVGAALGALILLGIDGFFWWRGRKRSLGSETSAAASALETTETKSKKKTSELEGNGVIPSELQGTPKSELPC